MFEKIKEEARIALETAKIKNRLKRAKNNSLNLISELRREDMLFMLDVSHHWLEKIKCYHDEMFKKTDTIKVGIDYLRKDEELEAYHNFKERLAEVRDRWLNLKSDA